MRKKSIFLFAATLIMVGTLEARNKRGGLGPAIVTPTRPDLRSWERDRGEIKLSTKKIGDTPGTMEVEFATGPLTKSGAQVMTRRTEQFYKKDTHEGVPGWVIVEEKGINLGNPRQGSISEGPISRESIIHIENGKPQTKAMQLEGAFDVQNKPGLLSVYHEGSVDGKVGTVKPIGRPPQSTLELSPKTVDANNGKIRAHFVPDRGNPNHVVEGVLDFDQGRHGKIENLRADFTEKGGRIVVTTDKGQQHAFELEHENVSLGVIKIKFVPAKLDSSASLNLAAVPPKSASPAIPVGKPVRPATTNSDGQN